ncbi:MAG: DUF3854 domain-containing protein [Deltaproteobacteria bacterium]|nr:DUF3854 domain-containing protein [Deltaproteobacteria bacterium]
MMSREEEERAKRHHYLNILLSAVYRGSLAPDHREDLKKSGLNPETIHMQRIRSVPPWLIPRLLGFNIPNINSALLFPFPDPSDGFMDHVRMKIFPIITNRDTQTIKYLQPKNTGVRLFFPYQAMEEVLHGLNPLWLVEGEKKSLAVAQIGLPAVGFCGIEGWHRKGSIELIPDFDHIPLKDRVVELVPDGDVQTNPFVRRGTERFSLALQARGARPRLVVLPGEVAA